MGRYYNDYYPETLEHSGTKGMKWGLRRWQYEDGRFNEAGKARYFGSRGNKRISHKQLVKSTNAKVLYKNRSRLSDKELQNRLNRLNMEDQLKQKAKNNYYKKAKGAVKEVLAVAGLASGVYALQKNPAVQAAANVVKKAVLDAAADVAFADWARDLSKA